MVLVMIAFVMVCLGLIVMLALIVEICDAATASSCRGLAAERRKRWETRMPGNGRARAVRGRPSRVA
jgi:hypothetical protein